MMQRMWVRWAAVVAVALMVSAGCESKQSESAKTTGDGKPAAEKPADAGKPAAGKSAAGAAVVAKLAAADAVDGKVDKIVTRCGGCKLGMDGKAELAFKTHGYTMHFCNPGCKKRFADDTDKEILALTIPSE